MQHCIWWKAFQNETESDSFWLALRSFWGGYHHSFPSKLGWPFACLIQRKLIRFEVNGFGETFSIELTLALGVNFRKYWKCMLLARVRVIRGGYNHLNPLKLGWTFACLPDGKPIPIAVKCFRETSSNWPSPSAERAFYWTSEVVPCG